MNHHNDQLYKKGSISILRGVLSRFTIVAILCALLLLSGCWDMRYLDKLGVVVAIGVDEDPTGEQELQVTAQFVLTQNMSASSKQGGSGTPVTIYTETGDTIFEALRKMSTQTSRRLFFSHTQMLIIGEKIAGQGIYRLLDLIERNPDIRTDISVAITRGMTAKQLLQTMTQMESIPINQILDTIEVNQAAHGTNYKVTVLDLIRIKGTGISEAVAPSFYLKGNRKASNKPSNIESIPAEANPVIGTMAVFRDGKLVGYLLPNESRGLSWMKEKVKSTVVQLACPAPASEGYLTVEIQEATTKTKVKVNQNDMPMLHIEIRVVGGIREIMCKRLNVLEESVLNEIGQLTSAAVKEEVEAVIERMQQSKSDGLSWGEEIYHQKPHLWRRIEGDWPRLFPKIDYRVVCEVDIVGSGARNESILK